VGPQAWSLMCAELGACVEGEGNNAVEEGGPSKRYALWQGARNVGVVAMWVMGLGGGSQGRVWVSTVSGVRSHHRTRPP
jgi:hypothetical protein